MRLQIKLEDRPLTECICIARQLRILLVFARCIQDSRVYCRNIDTFTHDLVKEGTIELQSHFKKSTGPQPHSTYKHCGDTI